MGGKYLGRVVVQRGSCPYGTRLAGSCLGGSCPEGSCLGSNCLGGSCREGGHCPGQLSRRTMVIKGEIIHGKLS
jgi:hypothetical protein